MSAIGHCRRRIGTYICITVLNLLLINSSGNAVQARPIVQWDFTKEALGWTGNRDVQDLAASPDGLAFKSTGQDPWIEGPAVDLPGVGPARLTIRMKSTADAAGELFYGPTFTAAQSVRFTVDNDGRWHDYTLVIRDKLGAGTRFRLDPSSGPGQITVASIKIELLPEIAPPPLQKPDPPDRSGGLAGAVRSGVIVLEHYAGRWGNFAVKVDDVEMAAGYQSELIGVLLADRPQWLNLRDARVTSETKAKDILEIRADIQDAAGGNWQLRRTISAGDTQGTIVVQTQFSADKDTQVLHLPWLTLFPGLGTFGQAKYQGLFAGLEYLGDEPSSSQADIKTPEHIRRVPDPVKVTFPLMAISNAGRYIGLVWETSDLVAPSFDSPDRIYNSDSHLFALSAPAVGLLRFENALVAYCPFKLRANEPVSSRAYIIAGKDKTVVGAVRHYFQIKSLPPVPRFEGGLESAVTLLSQGWLESSIRQDGLFRHAVWGNSFPPAPAADAAMFIDWLASNLAPQQREYLPTLESARDEVLAKVGQSIGSCVSHTRPPTAPFVFGGLLPYIQQRKAHAFALLSGFDERGLKLYKPGRTDYSSTHFEKHANGLAGADLVNILEAAALSGDKELIAKSLELLDKNTLIYADTVPRGAQTWEVPLHTPDILASAHLTKAYTLAYVISGKSDYLDCASYWAWTGVPFVYLRNPTSGSIGPYATIAVLGATNWEAPVWLGRPVQWCGLVYSSALHLLSQYDTQGPWKQIAEGVTTVGLQMSWPAADTARRGLLPDVFELRPQLRAGPAINPGTVQSHVPELYGKGRIYDLKKLQKTGCFVHAPCAITDIHETDDTVAFIVDGWAGSNKPYYVLLSGIDRQPAQVMVRKLSSSLQPDFSPASATFSAESRLAVISLAGKSEIQIKF